MARFAQANKGQLGMYHCLPARDIVILIPDHVAQNAERKQS